MKNKRKKNEFLDKLEQIIKQSENMVSKYAKSIIIQNEAVNIIEGFFYSNAINNFKNNFTNENLKEFNISKTDLRNINKEFDDIYYRCQQTIKTGSSKGKINSDVYLAFRNKLNLISRNCYRLLIELEKEIEITSCKNAIDDFKKKVIKIENKNVSRDNWLPTVILETIIKAEKEIPNSKKLSKIIDQIMLKILPKSADVLLKDLKKTSSIMLKERRIYQAGFNKRLIRRWRKPIDLIEMFYEMALESGGEFNKEHREEAAKNQDFIFDALTRIHARGCQIFFEILTLLKSGLADGAFARWRSLHELAVISFYLRQHEQNVAERYINHIIIENYKEAEDYQKQCRKIGYKPLTRKQFQNMKKEKDRVCAKYGKDFYQDYGWIPSNILKDKKFKGIEKSIKMDMWRPFYKMACINIHAGSKSLRFRLGLIQSNSLNQVLLAGPSNYGLADPAQNAAISLNQITSCLLTTKPTIERLITVTAMQKLVKEIGKAFCGIQFQIEREDKNIKKELKKANRGRK